MKRKVKSSNLYYSGLSTSSAVIIPVPNTVISNSPLAAPHEVLPCPVNLQIQEEDPPFSHHRQCAPGYSTGVT